MAYSAPTPARWGGGVQHWGGNALGGRRFSVGGVGWSQQWGDISSRTTLGRAARNGALSTLSAMLATVSLIRLAFMPPPACLQPMSQGGCRMTTFS